MNLNSIGRALVALMTTTSAKRTASAAGRVLQTVNKGDNLKTKNRMKVDIAIQRLGANYVLHPEYTPIPRHSNHQEIWWPNRTLQYPEVRYKDSGRGVSAVKAFTAPPHLVAA